MKFRQTGRASSQFSTNQMFFFLFKCSSTLLSEKNTWMNSAFSESTAELQTVEERGTSRHRATAVIWDQLHVPLAVCAAWKSGFKQAQRVPVSLFHLLLNVWNLLCFFISTEAKTTPSAFPYPSKNWTKLSRPCWWEAFPVSLMTNASVINLWSQFEPH